MNVKLQADLSTEVIVDVINQDKKQFKNYTGLTLKQFHAVYAFYVPSYPNTISI